MVDRGKYLRGDEHGTDGGELIEGFGKEELAAGLVGELVQATREVVAHGVAEDIVGSLLGRDVFAGAGGDENKLGFVVRECGGAELVHRDVFVGVGERSGGLGPEGGSGGNHQLEGVSASRSARGLSRGKCIQGG